MSRLYNLEGTYTFSQDGEVLGSVRNLITDEGRKLILRYLAGIANTIGGAISVGLGTTTAATSDTSLAFEYARATVAMSSVDFINNRLVFKGTLSQDVAGIIQEAGVFSMPYPTGLLGYNSRVISLFANVANVWTNSTTATTNSRVGTSLRVSATASATTSSVLSDMVVDLSGYSTADIIKIALVPVNANVASLAIRLRGSDSTSYYEKVVTPATSGYQVLSFTKGSMTKVGTTVDFANINSIELRVTAGAGGTGTMDFDALRIESVSSPDDLNVLVSRTILSTPITKTSSSPMDVEYAIKVTVA